MSICSCGRELESQDRYCSQCGAAAGTATHVAGSAETVLGIDRDEDSLLIGAGGESDSIETRSQVSSPPSRLWILAGTAAVGLLMWGLFNWPGAESETAVGQDSAEDGDDARDDDEGSGSDDGTTTTARRTTTTTKPRRSTAVSSVSSGGDGTAGEPWLVVGERTGLGVVVGNFNISGPMELLELDSGRVHELENGLGLPVAALGSSVVTWGHNGVFILDLTEADEESIKLGDESTEWVEFLEVADDRIWTSHYSETDDQQTLVAYGVDGEVIESRATADEAPWWFASPSSEFVSGRVGGVYRPVGDRFELLSTGRLLAVGQNLALVDECDERLNCGLRWMDKRTWDRLDFPAATGSVWSGNYSIVAGDRFLIAAQWRSEERVITEIATGEVVRTLPMRMDSPTLAAAPISDDGRWLVDLSVRDAPVIVDLYSGTEWAVPSFGQRGSEAIIIDLSETAFASPAWDGTALCSSNRGPAAQGPPAGSSRC